jgi:hypothetical protein
MNFPGVDEPFPEREEDILDLAMRIIEAMEQDPETFRDAPYSATQLRAQIEEVRAAITAAATADQAQRQAFAKKERSLQVVKAALKDRLETVEMDVRGVPEKLSGLGWGGSEATDRLPPGAVREVAVESQVEASVVLQWRPPVEGGPAAEYRIQRRKPGGAWEDAATTPDNDCLLCDQPRGIELDLRVMAVNQAGAGPASEPVTVVL